MIDFEKMRRLMARECRAQFNLDKARSRATSTTQRLSGMPSGSGSGDQMDRKVMQIMEAEQALHMIQFELKAMRAVLLPLIDTVRRPETRSAMYLRYIKGKSVRDIAMSMAFSEPHTFKLVSDGEDEINEKT